jgi:hypothetical protein
MSEMVNALAMALGARKYEKPIACCPSCEAPLVSTILFAGAEFYCLDCARGCSFVAPIEGDPDDAELAAKLERYEAEWNEHIATDPHGHLTDEAREWLRERQSQ